MEGLEQLSSVFTLIALEKGLELAVEEVGEKAVISLEESLPTLSGVLIGLFALFSVVVVGLVDDSIQIFMHLVHEGREELLRVVLLIPVEQLHFLVDYTLQGKGVKGTL